MADLTDVLSPTIAAIYAHHETQGNKDKGHRVHLGASVIGRECKRELWYLFRWCVDIEHTGRLLRLFETGHRAEPRFIEELRAVGIKVYDRDDRTGEQFRFSHYGGHFGGSMDGVAKKLPEKPDQWHVLEFKTYNNENFEKLKKNGMEKAKPEHYAQCQLYMGWAGLERAFYLAVNKDTDELYSERVQYDKKTYSALMRKALDIIKSPTPLERINDNPEYYYCKYFCDFAAVCHHHELPAVNCRTCTHSTPQTDGAGGWSCAYHNDAVLTEQQQRYGCQHHLFIPALISFAEPVDADASQNWIEYTIENENSGAVFFKNGGNGPGCYSSKELRNSPPPLLGDNFTETLRTDFNARFEAE